MEFPDAWRRIIQLRDMKGAESQRKMAAGVHWFPITVITNCPKLNGLTQHKFIIVQLWMSEYKMGQQGCIPSEPEGGNPFPCLF